MTKKPSNRPQRGGVGAMRLGGWPDVRSSACAAALGSDYSSWRLLRSFPARDEANLAPLFPLAARQTRLAVP